MTPEAEFGLGEQFLSWIDTIPWDDLQEQPADVVKPAIEELVLTPRGLGPLVLGEPISESVLSSGVAVWDADHCGDRAETSGRFVPGYREEPRVWGGESPPFGLAVEGSADRIRAIEVFAEVIQTDRGVGLGSTEKELLRAYAPHEIEGPFMGGSTHLYYVRDGVGLLVFDVASYADYFPEGLNERVVVLTLYRDDGQMPYSTVGSDEQIGGCL